MWFKKHRVMIIVGLLTLIGAFLRLYRLPSTVMFQGDQGRDAIVVKQLIVDYDPILIGPVTSVGNMYLGPFYYYFMAPFLAITYPNPIGPAIAVAFVSVLTIPLVYVVTKEMFSQRAGLISTFIFTFMTTAVVYSRFSWNPNLAPLFGLLTIWCLYRMMKLKNYWYLVLATLSFAVLIQLHYVALLMAPVMLIWVIISLIRNKQNWQRIAGYSLLSLLVLLITTLPLIIFDIRHNQIIQNAFLEFFTGEDEYIQPFARMLRVVRDMEGRSFLVLAQLNQSPNGVVDRLVVFGSITWLIILWLRKKVNFKTNIGLQLVLIILLVAIVGTAFFASQLYPHYLLYLLPAVSMYFGYLLSELWRFHLLGKVFSALLLLVYLYGNLSNNPVLAQPGPSMAYYKRVAENILPHVSSDRYNIALLSESKDYKGMNYRYFLEVTDKPPTSHDDYQNLGQLVVIDELKLPDPLSVNIYEIEAPKLTTITHTFSLPDGPTIYVLE